MVIESTNGIQRLTSINLVENVDGIHKTVKNIGYVAEEPFVVLAVLLNKYFIQSYCGQELYPVGYCSFKYSISIEDEGDRRRPRNLYKGAIHDTTSFESLNEDLLMLACIDKLYYNPQYEEYLKLLSNSKDSIEDLQLAIDHQDIISSMKYGVDKTYKSTIKDIVDKYGFGDDCRISSLVRFVYQYFVEIYYK